MGLIKWFSSDSRTCTGTERVIEKMVRVNSTPDPTKFVVLKKEIIKGFPVFIVQYQDVENYEGRKILMYPRDFNTDLLQNRMDPHFFTKSDSPIARFEPTAYGWLLAETLANNL